MTPNFLVIGAPRAGTTWIAKNLQEHPDIFVPILKEIHYFDRNYHMGMEFYENFFRNVTNKKAVGEVTPSYLFTPEVPALINKHLPGVKLVVCLRNPVERLYSHYRYSKARYSSDKDLSFEEKIKKNPELIEQGFYYDHLLRYYEYFSKENILVLLYDELESTPEKFMRKIYSYLGVDVNYSAPLLDNNINSASSFKYSAKSEVLWYFYRILLKLRAFSMASLVENYNRNEYPQMKDETKRWLVEEIYFEKNSKLQELIDKDLSKWNQFDS